MLVLGEPPCCVNGAIPGSVFCPTFSLFPSLCLSVFLSVVLQSSLAIMSMDCPVSSPPATLLVLRDFPSRVHFQTSIVVNSRCSSVWSLPLLTVREKTPVPVTLGFCGDKSLLSGLKPPSIPSYPAPPRPWEGADRSPGPPNS